jgi:hypothetical protein
MRREGGGEGRKNKGRKERRKEGRKEERRKERRPSIQEQSIFSSTSNGY